MGATSTESKSFSFPSSPPAATSTFNLKGGTYAVEAVFASLVTAVELQGLGPDGSTFLSIGAGLKVSTSPGSVVGQVPPGVYKFVLTGGGSTGSAFMSVTEIPT